MIIKSVEIQNFLSFYDKHFFYYPDRGLTLIIGYNFDSVDASNDGDVLSSNGAGKTALCVAPLWCMYGILERDIDKKDDVVNREAGKDCVVKVELEGGIRIERGRQPNFLRLFINDEEKTFGTVSETQREINKLIGNPQMFQRIFTLSGDKISEFMNSFKGVRRAFIESLFGLDMFDLYRDSARDKLKETIREISDEQVRLESVRKIIEQTERKLEELKKKNEEHTSNISSSIDSTKKDLEKYQSLDLAEYDRIKSEYNKCDYTIIQAKANAKSIALDIKNKKEEISLIVSEILPEVCPTCNQLIADYEHYKENKKLEIKKIEDGVAKAEESLKSFNETIKQQNEIKSKLKKDIEDKYYSMTKEEILLTISTLSEKIHNHEKVGNSANPYSVAQEQLQKTIQECEQNEREILKRITSLNNSSDMLQICESVLGPNGVRQQKIYDIVQRLNINIESILQELNPIDYMPFEFDTNFEDIHGNYSTMSKGERRKVDIAIAIAIMQLVLVNSDCNIMFLDELLDSLDPVGVDMVIDLLREKCSDMSSVFLIAHNSTVKNSFEEESVITIIKKDKRSYIKGDKLSTKEDDE